jgi:hypothetical protein
MTEMTVATHLPVLDKPRYESTGKLAANLEMKVRSHIQLINGDFFSRLWTLKRARKWGRECPASCMFVARP